MNEYIEWAKTALRRWKDFSGRARRKEYWSYTIASFVAVLIATIVDRAIFGEGKNVISALLSLGLLVPTLAAYFRRLHDSGKSGWWLLLWLVPIVGWIVIFIFTLLDSQPGGNKYGANPKGI